LRNQPEASIPLFDEAIQLASTNPTSSAQKAKLAYILKSAARPRFALKQTDAGLQLLERSQEMSKQIFDADPSSNLALMRLSEIHQELALRYISSRDFAKGSPHAKESYRLNAIRYRNDPARTRLAYSASIGQLAAVALNEKNSPEAIRLYREMVALRREVVAAEPSDISAQVRLASAIDRLGNTLSNAQQHPEAIRQLDDALQLLRKFHAADKANSNTHRELLYTMGDLSEAYGRSGNSTKACAFAREFLAEVKTAGPSTMTMLKRHSDHATERIKNCR
jgi:tetratricopeptide (TPR) repeat protein